MNKNILFSILATVIILGGTGFFLFQSSEKNSSETKNTTQNSEKISENVEVKDGVQYITISAKGGYSPRSTTAKAGIFTKLKMETNGTYDCSSSLSIRQKSIQKNLPPTGETIFDLGKFSAGEKLAATCSMGMYNFSLQFQE